jgi:protein NrfD
VTPVFFLFLLHLSLGLLVTLPLVPARAGRTFFKFCSAAAVTLTTSALGLLYRRFGLAGGPGAPAGTAYRALLLATAALMILTVLYNRAWHFGWKPLQGPFLAGAVGAGFAAVVLAAPGPVFLASDVTSLLLLGVAASAMVLGHFYLVVLDLPITALRRLTAGLVAALALRAGVVAVALAGPSQAGYAEARLIAAGLWSPDGIFVWMRLLFGIAGPLCLVWFIWKTVKIRSTQSATGILYVQLFLVMAGELLAQYLSVAAGFPL